jgi:hypothetical protein
MNIIFIRNDLDGNKYEARGQYLDGSTLQGALRRPTSSDEEKMDIAFVWNMVLLLGVGVFIGIMQRLGRMTSNRFALIAVAYLSIFAMSALHADPAPLSPGARRFEVVLLLGIWILGYPMARWIYEQRHS